MSANYAYQRNTNFKRDLLSLKNAFGNAYPIYLSTGSLGDHAVAAALIENCLFNSEDRIINIISPKAYVRFFQTFVPNKLKILQVDDIGPLDNFFSTDTSWLYDRDFPVRPLLPVYYPVTSELIDSEFISQTFFLKYILEIPKNSKLTFQKSFTSLKEEVKKIFTGLGFHEPPIIICPLSNSLQVLSNEFWKDLIEKLNDNFSGRVLINAPYSLIDDLKLSVSIKHHHFEPHLVFAALDASACNLLSPSGLSHLAKHLTLDASLIVICDYRLGERVPQKFVNNKFFKASRQEQVIFEEEKNSAQYYRIADENFDYHIEEIIAVVRKAVKNK